MPVMLKIMLEGGHSLILLREEQAAKEMIREQEDYWKHSALAPLDLNRRLLLQGVESIRGKSWHWSIKMSSVIGMHTMLSEGDPTGASLPEVPWRMSG